MLFHSQEFILIFLPALLSLYYLVANSPSARQTVLLCGSLIFYGWWDVRFVPLLIGQVTRDLCLGPCARKNRPARLPHPWHHPQPRLARDLQISRFPHRQRRGADRHRLAACRHRAAHRNQLLLLPAHLLSHRPHAGRSADLSVPRICALRHGVPASHRRADRAAQRAHSPIRARPAPRRCRLSLFGGACTLHLGACEESAPRRRVSRDWPTRSFPPRPIACSISARPGPRASPSRSSSSSTSRPIPKWRSASP